jgi:mono/diheme cytochrome c family protein
VNEPSGKNLIAPLIEGHTPKAMQVDQRMPDFAGSYSNEELAAVSTFVLQRLGQTQGQVKTEDIEKSRASALH